MKFAYVALAALLASPAWAAQDEGSDDDTVTFAEVEGWSVYAQSNKTCAALSIFANDEFVRVEYDAATKKTDLNFSHKNATSLKKGDKRQLDILFNRGGQIDDGWRENEFTVGVLKSGARMLSSPNLLPPFLDDFAKSKVIGFYYGKKLLGAYNLADSAKMVVQLRKCAMKQAGINPLDPFAAD